MRAISPIERRIITTLAGIFSLRMLGLFMILPVFSLYATQLSHSNTFLIGCALGIYGLTQTLLQIPFGFASDRFGRKPLIFLGLALFVLGSVVAACSSAIYGIIGAVACRVQAPLVV
jgi:MFS family permease